MWVLMVPLFDWVGRGAGDHLMGEPDGSSLAVDAISRPRELTD